MMYFRTNEELKNPRILKITGDRVVRASKPVTVYLRRECFVLGCELLRCLVPKITPKKGSKRNNHEHQKVPWIVQSKQYLHGISYPRHLVIFSGGDWGGQ